MSNNKHGLSSHKGYAVWRLIKSRCYDKKCKAYPRYGGRGITLAEEWLDDVAAFIKYVESLPNAFQKGYSLDRINNNEGYYKNNLRWATRKTQAENSEYGFTGKSKYRGVIQQGKKWQATLLSNGKSYYLGLHNTDKEAAIAYDNKCIELGLKDKILNRQKYKDDFENYEETVKIAIRHSTFKAKLYEIKLSDLPSILTSIENVKIS